MNLISSTAEKLESLVTRFINIDEPNITIVEKTKSTLIYTLVVIPGGCAIWVSSILQGPISDIWKIEDSGGIDNEPNIGDSESNGQKKAQKEAEGAAASPA